MCVPRAALSVSFFSFLFSLALEFHAHFHILPHFTLRFLTFTILEFHCTREIIHKFTLYIFSLFTLYKSHYFHTILFSRKTRMNWTTRVFVLRHAFHSWSLSITHQSDRSRHLPAPEHTRKFRHVLTRRAGCSKIIKIIPVENSHKQISALFNVYRTKII